MQRSIYFTSFPVIHNLHYYSSIYAGPSGRAVQGVGLRRACLLRSWVRIPPGEWMSVCCECCVLSGRVLCDELITRLEESYRLWFVVVCDLEKQTSWMRRPRPTGGLSRQEKKNPVYGPSYLIVRKLAKNERLAFVISWNNSTHDLLIMGQPVQYMQQAFIHYASLNEGPGVA